MDGSGRPHKSDGSVTPRYIVWFIVMRVDLLYIIGHRPTVHVTSRSYRNNNKNIKQILTIIETIKTLFLE